MNQTPSKDTRIALGARCTWWDSIDKVGRAWGRSGPIPACPHCNNVLYELPSQADWDERVDAYIARSGNTEYKLMMDWARGKCFPNIHALDAAYQRAKAEGFFARYPVIPPVAVPEPGTPLYSLRSAMAGIARVQEPDLLAKVLAIIDAEIEANMEHATHEPDTNAWVFHDPHYEDFDILLARIREAIAALEPASSGGTSKP